MTDKELRETIDKVLSEKKYKKREFVVYTTDIKFVEEFDRLMKEGAKKYLK